LENLQKTKCQQYSIHALTLYHNSTAENEKDSKLYRWGI
jgi:hypothetical protein